MFRKKKITCVVPARGGSKGIKNKNLIDFYGMPLILGPRRRKKIEAY